MQINFESEKPIFVQLADWLSDSIISGAIKEGEQIPSTTEMSVSLKINPATALKGVNMLVDKGIIYKKRGLGMFVSEGAVEKLKKKLAEREEMQEKMKYANVVARRKKEEKPYPAYALSNNSAEIRRLKKRIEELENKPRYEGWKFNGGVVEIDEAENRLRIRHDEKPAQEVLDELKLNGFRWSPRNGAWQRQITPAAMRAARRIVGGW